MELKWFVVILCVLIGGMYGGYAVVSAMNKECKVAAIQKGSVTDNLCKQETK